MHYKIDYVTHLNYFSHNLLYIDLEFPNSDCVIKHPIPKTVVTDEEAFQEFIKKKSPLGL